VSSDLFEGSDDRFSPSKFITGSFRWNFLFGRNREGRPYLGENRSLTIIDRMKRENALRKLALCTVFLALWLSSCVSKPETSVPSAGLLQPIPTMTPNPDFTTSAESTSGVNSSGSGCENDARFLEDLTYPDGEVVVPGQTIDKRWSVQNNGSCDWGPDYRLIHLGEDDFEAQDAVALYPARGGTNAIWQVGLQAPREVGQYVSQWQAQAPDGTMFGDVVYILISVEKPTPTPTATPLISSTPTP